MTDWKEVEEYSQKWAAYCTEDYSGQPDGEQIRQQVIRIYEDLGLKRPEVIITPSPQACLTLIEKRSRLTPINGFTFMFDKMLSSRIKLLPMRGKTNNSIGDLHAHLPDASLVHTHLLMLHIFNQIYYGLSQAGNFNYGFTTPDGFMKPDAFITDTYCGHFGYIDFLSEILGLKEAIEKLFSWYKIGQPVQWLFAYAKTCFVSLRPSKMYWQNRRLHNDGGPAILYRDGAAFYALHGVKVSRDIAETPAVELDARLIYKEKNAEVRREIVRKIGLERLCLNLNARCLDKQGDYELLLLKTGAKRSRPYLKMINPSTGNYHIEGVTPGITTVQEALAWRNGTKDIPVVLT